MIRLHEDAIVPPVSVIVPEYRAAHLLPRCVRSLLEQDYSGRLEVIVVSSSDGPQSLDLPSDPRLRVISHVPRLSAAKARNRGVLIANGELLVFTDADVEAPPGWLAALVEATQGGKLAVAGGVINGTPGSAVGTTEYLVEFLDLHPSRPARTAWHGATCNLLVPRLLWEKYGPFPESLDGGEDTVMTAELRRDGLFAFCGPAAVIHHNRTRLGEVLRHQYEFGRFTARIGRRCAYRFRPLVGITALAPVAAVLRVASIYSRAFAWRRSDVVADLRLLPIVVAAMGCWGAGLLGEGIRLDVAAARPWFTRRSAGARPPIA